MNCDKHIRTPLKKGLMLLFVLLLPHLHIFGQGTSLKLSGGLSYLLLDEVNRIILDRSLNENRTSDRLDNWTMVLDNTQEFHSATSLEGELLFRLGGPVMIGLGTGILYGEVTEDQTEISLGYTESGEIRDTFVFVQPVKVNATPLVLSLYYRIDLSRRIFVHLKAGGGLLWAKYIDRQGTLKLPNEKYVYPDFQRTQSSGTIVQGGLGIAFLVQSGLHLFLEGNYRQSTIADFTGVNKKGESGTLYYLEEYDPVLDFWQAKYRILTEIPDREDIRSVRAAQVDFSGWALSIGLIIQF